MSTASEIVDATTDAIMADEKALRRFVRERVRDGLALMVKAEWDMEDNFATTEQLAEDMRKLADLSVSDVEVIAATNDIELDNIEPSIIGDGYSEWYAAKEAAEEG